MTTRWQSGPSPAGYDSRLSLSNFLYDSARQADALLHGLGVLVLPDEGLPRQFASGVTGVVIPALAGADEIKIGNTYLAYDGLEVIWQIYTPQAGAAGTALGDFPASHHADVVAAVIAIFAARTIWAVDAVTRQIENPPLRRGWYRGINFYNRVQSDVNGWLQSVVSTDAIAYIADERTPQTLDATVLKDVDYIRFGIGADQFAQVYRRFDVATGVWADE